MQRTLIIITLFLFTLPITLLAVEADTHKLGVGLEVGLWLTIFEQSENGLKQTGTLDKGTEITSGFNFTRGRVAFNYRYLPHNLLLRLQIRLEERVDILDGYVGWEPKKWFRVYLGQMKVPSTYEALTSGSSLDFISRSSLSKSISDWSLSRASYYGSFYGNLSYYRDLGLAIKGTLALKERADFFKYFLMISNGLGQGLYIGGRESKEYIYTNDVGDFFYGLRLELSPFKFFQFGGHISHNKHDNMVFNDERTVFDLKRQSWSVDLRFDLPHTRITGMYGGGLIDDDFFHSGKKNLEYSGWEAAVIFSLWKERLELGARYDAYITESHESGNEIEQNNLTLGANLQFFNKLRIMLNYIFKDTVNDIEPDLDDDILYMSVIYAFSVEDLLNKR